MLFFAVEIEQKPILKAGDDVANIDWVKITELQPEKFAFASAREAIALYLKKMIMFLLTVAENLTSYFR